MRRKKDETVEKILDVDASMQGSLSFKDPVNLRINGKFDGKLETKGSLTIGEHARVSADIQGESVTIAGTVLGDITSTKDIKLINPARVTGNIATPMLSVEEGAVLDGNVRMKGKASSAQTPDTLSIDEVAKYLEVDKNVVVEWADTGRLPAVKAGSSWRFDRTKIEDWLTSEKIK